MTAVRNRRTGDEVRAAILAAAVDEFAIHGLSSGRIDRIAVAAQASKERLYSYYGDKQGLVRAVLQEMCVRVSAAVVLDGDDLPGYAAGLTKHFLSHPDDLRLTMWARLDPSDVAAIALPPRPALTRQIAEVARAQREGIVDNSTDAATLLQLITAIATFWADETYRPRPRTGRERTACLANASNAVTRLIAPLDTGSVDTDAGDPNLDSDRPPHSPACRCP